MKMIVCLLALLMAVIVTAEGGTDDEKSCPQDYPITDTDYGNKTREGSILYTINYPRIYKIVLAIANKRDRAIQDEFNQCISYQPQQLLDATKDCVSRFNIDTSNGNDGMWDKFAEDPQFIKELGECVRQNTTPFVPADVGKMCEFEYCAEKVYAAYFEGTTQS